MAEIRIAGIVRESIVDGPGFRFVVFTQGCPHQCEGCHNPQSHSFAGGCGCTPQALLEEIDKNPLLAGVTLSGGEPFCQPEALCELAEGIKRRGLDLMVYSGYTYEQLVALQSPAAARLLALCDTLVDGRFELAQRDLTLLFRGSRNQRVIDLAATRAADAVVLAKFAYSTKP